MELVSIGYGSYVSAGRIVAAVEPESNPIKRVVAQARDSGKLVDATYGRKTESVRIMDSGHVSLCPLPPETVAQRAGDGEEE